MLKYFLAMLLVFGSSKVFAGHAFPQTGEDFTNSSGLRFIWIPKLKVWVANREISERVFDLIIKGEAFESGRNTSKGDVSWQEATDFCEQLTKRDFPGSSKYTYRLPSDDEFEFLQEYVPENPDLEVKNGAIRRRSKPQKNSEKPPIDQTKLQDIRGSLWEWVLDKFTGEHAQKKGDVFFKRFADQGLHFVRGASDRTEFPFHLRHAERIPVPDGYHSPEIGFRVVLVESGAFPTER